MTIILKTNKVPDTASRKKNGFVSKREKCQTDENRTRH